MSIKLVIFDADKTLWDHPDVSLMKPPFQRIDEDTLVDTIGSEIHLYKGVREMLQRLKEQGIVISLASWNAPEPCLEAFEKLDLLKYFTHPKVRPHPEKYKMIKELLEDLRGEGIEIEPNEILYVDDKSKHLSDVRKQIGEVCFLHMWVDVKDHLEILEYVPGCRDDAARTI